MTCEECGSELKGTVFLYEKYMWVVAVFYVCNYCENVYMDGHFYSN